MQKDSWSCQTYTNTAKHILIKQKSPVLPRNLALLTIGKLLIVFWTKINLLHIPPQFNVSRCCLLHLIKQNCLLKTFLITLILMTQVSLSLFSLLELIWNCIIFLQQPRWFKRSWWILNCQRQIANCPDCIPVVDLKNYEPEVSYILAKLLNMCLKETYFLDCWKVSSVVPVFKNVMERFTAKNYQPVSLQSVVNKVFEKTCK